MKITENMRERTKKLMEFLDASPTASWTAKNAEEMLKKNGFEGIDEGTNWNLSPGDKFFVNRGGSAFVAGIIGKEKLMDNGFNIIGAHTDSPGFRVKSNSIYENEGYIQLGVEIYGAPLLASWTDRDLSLAGEIVVENNGELESRLWKSDKKLLRISQLPIHLNREANDEGLKLEKEKHLPPIIGLSGDKDFTRDDLIDLISEDMGIENDKIKEFQLELYDTQNSSIFGINEEFFVSGRIDNLMMSYSGITALSEMEDIPDRTSIIALFDHEEIGSKTANGGASPLLENILERISLTQELDREEFLVSLSNSFLFSADGAHAVHPNYPDEFEKHHKVKLNKGPVIKLSANQNYVTNPGNTAFFKEICKKADAPVQKYIHRADKKSGSTIGPITSTKTGINTIDAGSAMVSMHSAREMAGVADTEYIIRVMKEFLKR